MATTYKLLTGIMAEDIYRHIDNEGLFPDEQKGCKKKSRGTKDQLLIDKMVLRNSRRRKTNLSMAWIDYKKAYDMVPHSWVIETLKLGGVAENVRRLVENSMQSWATNLTSAGEHLGKVNIRRGIFQGDSLSPLLFIIAMIPLSKILRKNAAGYKLDNQHEKINHLLFMDDLKLYGKNEKEINSLIQTVRIFSEDIKMEFGIDKCATVNLKRGKMYASEGIELPDGTKICDANNEGYKYLGVLELDQIKHKEMKERVTKEYYKSTTWSPTSKS